MIQETLSNPIEILSQVNPREFLEGLSSCQLSVFGQLIDMSATCAYVNPSQAKMSDVADCTILTVNRAVSRLRNSFVIHTTRRFNKTSYYYITPFILSDPIWREELLRWFPRVPKPRFSLSLILSSIKQASESTIRPTFDIISRVPEGIKKTLKVFFNSVPSYLRSLKEGYPECQTMSNEKFSKIRSIGLAIRKRGSPFTNDDCANLAAYHKDVLDKAVAGMKGRKDLRNVAAYFLGMCKRIAQDIGIAPEWDIPQQLREAKIIFLRDDEPLLRQGFEGHAGTPPMKANAVPEPEKIFHPADNPVTEDVFAPDSPKTGTTVANKEGIVANKAVQDTKCLTLLQQHKLKKWKKKLNDALTAGNNEWATALRQMIEGLEPNYDPHVTVQNSNTAQERSSPGILESSGFKHFNPEAILKGFEYGDEEEE